MELFHISFFFRLKISTSKTTRFIPCPKTRARRKNEKDDRTQYRHDFSHSSFHILQKTAMATHRSTQSYKPDPNRQEPFATRPLGAGSLSGRVLHAGFNARRVLIAEAELRARNRRHVADMSPGPIAAQPRAATAFRSFLQAAPAATTVCRRKGRRDRPAAAVPDRRCWSQPISVAG